MTGLQVIQRVAETLHDTAYVRWTKPMLLRYLSDAQRTIVVVRPDTNPVTSVISLTAGATLQTIPANGYQLLDVIRNTDATGTVAGEVVTLTTRGALDTDNRDWHRDTLSETVFNYCLDDRVPQHFYVTPPPAAGVHIEIRYSKTPDEITDETAELEISSIYADSLVSYCLYRALLLNIDSALDQAKAKQMLAQFYLLIGQSAQAIALLSPNNMQINPTINVQAP